MRPFIGSADKASFISRNRTNIDNHISKNFGDFLLPVLCCPFWEWGETQPS